jgi:flagellar motor component MotA
MLIIIGFLLSVIISWFVNLQIHLYARYFIDVPSALLILIYLFFFFFTSKSGSIIGKYIRSSFKKNYNYTRVELVSLSVAIKNTIKFTLAVGGFGLLFGAIACLGAESYKEMGAPVAVSLITVFYAIIVSYIMFFPVQAWAENKLNSMGE